MNFWQGADDFDAQAELHAAGLTDGLPVVPPTEARVARMLASNGVAPDEVVTMLPPGFGEATWQAIAINAVMAGCLPEYLLVVGAAVEAMAAPEFNLVGIGTTTGSAWPLTIVNGPVAARIGMNAAGNALGPGNRANAAIGRAVSFVLRNVGGAKPGEYDMATLGQPAKYTCCFAENAAESPWMPLHVDRGFAADDSVVTVVGISGTIEIVDSTRHSAEDLAQTFAQSMLIAGHRGSRGLLGGGEPLLVMPPELADGFARDGYTKAMAKAAIFERAVFPLERLSSAMREHVISVMKTTGSGDPTMPLRVAEAAEDVMIVVAGGVGVKAMYAPTWSGSTRAVSRKVRTVVNGPPT
jgi:hypothetical protein